LPILLSLFSTIFIINKKREQERYYKMIVQILLLYCKFCSLIIYITFEIHLYTYNDNACILDIRVSVEVVAHYITYTFFDDSSIESSIKEKGYIYIYIYIYIYPQLFILFLITILFFWQDYHTIDTKFLSPFNIIENLWDT